MSNSIFKRFKKNKAPVIEEKPSVYEDRMFWISTLERIAFPILNNLSKDSLKKKMPVESISSDNHNIAYFDAFTRVFNGIAPWLELGADGSEEGKIREKYIYLTLKSISNAIDPKSNDFLFDIEPKESLVDVALFAQGLLRAKNQIWNNLPIKIQARIIGDLKSTRIIAPYENHWLLYTSMIEAALLEFTGECDKERLVYGVRKFRDELYIGDGRYSDGEDFEVGYYNSLFIHPMLNDILGVMRKYGLEEGEFLDVQLMRSSRLSSQLERLISPEGTYPLLGKYLSYRCGVFYLMSQAALLKILPRNIDVAQVRAALTKVLKTQFGSNKNFTSQGWLNIGLYGPQIDVAEDSVNTGTLYSCCFAFLALGLDKDDAFWISPSAPWTSLRAWEGQPIPQDQSVNF